jgi:thioredoxin-related protein
MKISSTVLTVLLFAAAPAFCATDTEKNATHANTGIAWYKGDVDTAFAAAKAGDKPLFLYWGAGWCPPCNQVKATIFKRQSFIERSRFFIPVQLDGDSPSAQKLGARFKVRGYPTMILFKPDGSEITRLPGEVDGEKYLQVLALGMNASHSVKDILQAALDGSTKLSADDWRLLGYYSWDTDEQQLLAGKDLPATLQRLAAACPPGDTATRLAMSALVAAAGAKPPMPMDKTAALQQIMKLLADARSTRENMDILTNNATELVELVSQAKSAERTRLISAWSNALQGLAADTTLSKTDRLGALNAQVSLARLETPTGALNPALQKTVKQNVAQADRTTTDPYERQTVINAAAHTLSDAGLLDDADTLLKAELKRSHSPYYFMLSLASNAKKRGDKTTALNWYEQAYQSAKGPATRLQWGTTYLGNLIDLTPQDEVRIEKAAHNVLHELNDTQNAFYERNRHALEKLGHKFAEWNKAGTHQAALERVQSQLDGVCAKLPAEDVQRTTCQGVLETSRLKL